MIAAIVPAAGLSTRMGRPKALLPIDGRPLVVRVIEALMNGGVDVVVVVVPPSDRAESAEITRLAEQAGASVVVPETQTADMRATIELGLDRVESLGTPVAILLCPVDTPGVRPELVRAILEQGRLVSTAIVVPSSGGKRRHPVYLPSEIAREVRRLPAGKGVNALLDAHGASVVEIDRSEPLGDIDTPDDYRAWVEASGD